MNIKQLQTYAANYPAVPITRQFQLKSFDPIAITQALDHPESPCFLLTGKPKKDEDGYSFIGINPTKSFTYRNGKLKVTNRTGETFEKAVALKPVIEAVLRENRTPHIPNLPPFLGGLAGYFSYDYEKYATTAQLPTVQDPMGLNDADLLLVDEVIAYNHTTKTVTLSKIVNANQLTNLYHSVIADLTNLQNQLLAVTGEKLLPPFSMTPLQLQFSLQEFTEKVAQTKQHIVDGDIFQLILSNPQQAQMRGSLFAAAPTLFRESPSPYQFYFRHNDFETIGASPETSLPNGDKPCSRIRWPELDGGDVTRQKTISWHPNFSTAQKSCQSTTC